MADSWDDSAILKAFEDAVGSHSSGRRKKGVAEEEEKQEQEEEQEGGCREEGVPGPWEPVAPREPPPAQPHMYSSAAAAGAAATAAFGFGGAPSHVHGAHGSAVPGGMGADPVLQALSSVHDSGLADLLMSWFYSGYYTGRCAEPSQCSWPLCFFSHTLISHVLLYIDRYQALQEMKDAQRAAGDPQGEDHSHQSPY
jgi:hypothetical protein